MERMRYDRSWAVSGRLHNHGPLATGGIQSCESDYAHNICAGEHCLSIRTIAFWEQDIGADAMQAGSPGLTASSSLMRWESVAALHFVGFGTLPQGRSGR
jgi:hypothetical protein